MEAAMVPSGLPAHFAPVALDKAYRMLNHGPTVLVSAAHDGVTNVMAAAWSMPLDFSPPKVAVVIDKATRTRPLVEASGCFVLNVPCQAMASQVLAVGTESTWKHPDKLARHGVRVFSAPDNGAPLVDGCVGWLVCRVLPEARNEQLYDLFLGEVTAAWADPRVFHQGHWEFATAPSALRTLHYVAGGQFFVIGDSLNAGAEP